MATSLRLAAVAVTLASTASLALADDVAAPAPAPAPVTTTAAAAAPQNESWDNVSHINGTPVPVGDRNQYLLDFKKTNISSNPIGWLVGFYGVSVEHALTQNLVVRADANFINYDHTSGFEGGLSLPLYLKRAYQGPFIEPGLVVRTLTHTCEGCSYDGSGNTDTHTLVGPEVMVGYHWTFDSGFNIAAALGVARNIDNNDPYASAEDQLEPVGYFRVGYAF